MKPASSRSRADKSRGNANPAVNTISNDIVPGKYTESDLIQTIEEESNDEYLFGIVNEIIEKSEQIIHQEYLKRRVAEHTVDTVKKALIEIIKWEFLSYDKNDNNESVWLEDEEPESLMIDSWAQGYIPKRQRSPSRIKSFKSTKSSKKSSSVRSPLSPIEYSEEENEDATIAPSEINEIEAEKTNIIDESIEHETEEPDFQDQEQPVETVSTLKETENKQKKKFKPYRGKLNFNDLNMLTETLYETEQRIEIERRREEMSKQKRLTSGSRSSSASRTENINHEDKVIQKLFSTSIKNYRNMKPTDILNHSNDQLLNVLRVGPDQVNVQRIKVNHKLVDQHSISKLSSNSNTSMEQTNQQSKKNDQSNQKGSNSKREEMRSPTKQGDKILPVSMIDSIDPVPGVTIQEGERIKKALIKKQDKTKQMEKELSNLNPIKFQSERTSELIEEIIKINDVKLKPLSKIPPILNGQY